MRFTPLARAAGALLVASLVAAGGVLAAGPWTATSKMTSVRYGHTVTAIDGNRAVAIGGFDDNTALASSEIFDAASGTWTKAGDMANPRYRHTATRIQDGRVLIVGGRNQTNAIAVAELFNPADGSFQPAGVLQTPRYDHAAVLGLDGKVYVFGGNTDQQQVGVDENEVPIYQNPALATIEVWDPATGIFTPGGSMTTDRALHGAVLLADGRILIAGGRGTTPEPGPDGSESLTRWSSEFYDPSAQASTPTSPMSVNRVDFALVGLPGGPQGASRVVAAGGYNEGQALNPTTEVFDPGSGTWSAAGPLNMPRVRAVQVALPDGTVALIGGLSEQATLASTEVFTPENAWVATGDMTEARDRAAGALLGNGQVVVAGGFTTGGFLGLGGGLNSAEVWTPGP